jgi:hypothetical protein
MKVFIFDRPFIFPRAQEVINVYSKQAVENYALAKHAALMRNISAMN